MSMSPINSSTDVQTLPGPSKPTARPQATTASSSANTGTSTSSAGVNNLSSTFLQLLTQELQNQDPTAPMDSTQMVGQMISLNQLEQLASINQTLSKSAGQTGTPAADSGAATGAAAGVSGSTAANAASAAIQAASLGTNLGTTSSLLQGVGSAGL